MNFKARKAYKDPVVASEYDKKRFHTPIGKIVDYLEKTTIEKAIKYISLPLNSKILDLPCGTGRISVFLSQKGYTVTGGDISQSMIKEAYKKTQKLNIDNKLSFHILDAEQIGCPDKIFDAIVSLRFFGHIPPKIRIQILKEFKRVCKRYFIIAYYLKDSFQEIRRRKNRLNKKSDWYPVSLENIDQEMCQAGIKKIKLFSILRYFSETVIVIGEIE